MIVLPEHDRAIRLRTVGRGHRYQVAGLSCGACANCKKGKNCIGLPSVSTITGPYGANLYGAGYRAGLNAVFGDAAGATGWLATLHGDAVDTARLPEYRQAVEAIPTPGDIARDYGTGVHAALEEWLKARLAGEAPFLEGDYMASATAIVDWLDRHECEVMDVEVQVYHPTLLYGGTIDCVVRRGGRPVVLDWKTGRAIYRNAAAQVAGYALAYEAMTGERVDEGWVVRSSKHEFEAKRIKDLDVAKWLFVNLHSTRENWDAIQWEDGT